MCELICVGKEDTGPVTSDWAARSLVGCGAATRSCAIGTWPTHSAGPVRGSGTMSIVHATLTYLPRLADEGGEIATYRDITGLGNC